MSQYTHHVSGIFSHQHAADRARLRLIEGGIPSSRIALIDSTTPPAASEQAKSNVVLKDMLVKGAIGTAVGTGIGALTEVALVAASVTIFVASPLVAPLALLGWGATLGATVGATLGAKVGSADQKSWLSDLVKDAIVDGQVMLVVKTLNQQETAITAEIIKLSVDNYKDVNMT
jgi:hypothetical protein